MPKTRLTDPKVRDAKLTEGKSEEVIWDEEVTGFGLRLRGSSKSFVVVYRPPGMGRDASPKRLKLGTPETIPNVKEARRLAKETLGKVAGGADPVAERAEKRAKSTARVTDLMDRYDKYMQRRGHVNRTTILSTLRRGLADYLETDVADLKGWQLSEIVENLEAAGKRGAADDFRARCSTFLNWCAFEARAIDANPLAGYRKGRHTRAEKVAQDTHGRALSDAELAAIWTAAGDASPFGRLVRFLMLTGCRRSEGAGLLRSMVDFDAARIDLPATFTKQARGHTVYIAPAVKALIKACPVDSRNPDLIFAATRTGSRLAGWSKFMDTSAKRPENGALGLVARSGVNFTLHDLRRTFRTGLSRLGVDREIAELALGHARADLESRYNRDDCEAEVKAAFVKWAEHVGKVLAG
ncbi:MAG: integrase arm-type DNA-binding domain-containing protein [Tabrizicola sp.]|jgi:integrase|nr:integrase arm-type DNA-binding domain-containing protein [Tabrizicola sp.]